jgi:DNA-binding response OmpR family regulator
MAKILLVEDDNDLANTVRTFLIFQRHAVERIGDGQDALDHLLIFDYELVILDWELPRVSGIEILREFRNRGSNTPILMLTGKDAIDEKLTGLDSGADDYLTKPFDLRELGARVNSLLRRPADIVDGNTFKAGKLALDPGKHSVFRDGELIQLVPREFQLLEFFMRHRNQLFTTEALLNRVWPSDSEATEEAVRTALKRLRKKIDPDGQVLKNVHGVGYILED